MYGLECDDLTLFLKTSLSLHVNVLQNNGMLMPDSKFNYIFHHGSYLTCLPG